LTRRPTREPGQREGGRPGGRKQRRAPRFKRRLPVRFWDPESGEVYQGYTVDISLHGMFIGTRTPLRKGTRFRFEILDPRHNYTLYGEVAHFAKVAPELQQVARSGMGVRLLAVSELVQEMIPAGASPQTLTEGARQPQQQFGGGSTEPSSGRYSMTGSSTAGAPDKEPEPEEEQGTYLLRFTSPEVFLQVFLNYHEEGGFYVPTRRPAAVGASIRVTLELLHGEVEPLELAGLVAAHRHEADDPARPATGMTVTFLDPDDAMARLRATIRRLRGDK
jgi:Tfp pilus assembly protein PilZ